MLIQKQILISSALILAAILTLPVSATEIEATADEAPESVIAEEYPAESSESVEDAIVPEEDQPEIVFAMNDEDDEWLFTMEELPRTEIVYDTPPQMDWRESVQENRLLVLLTAGILLVFGAGSLWGGCKMGAGRVFLRFGRGIRTTGTLTKVEWNSRTKSNCCTITYSLENGRTIDAQWPVQQPGVLLQNKLGSELTVFYNPEHPSVFDVNLFWFSKVIAILAALLGILLIAAAVAAAVIGVFFG